MRIGRHVIARYSCHITMKHKFSRKILETYPNIKFHETLFSGSSGVPCGRGHRRKDGRNERHDGANSRFSQFCEHHHHHHQ